MNLLKLKAQHFLISRQSKSTDWKEFNDIEALLCKCIFRVWVLQHLQHLGTEFIDQRWIDHSSKWMNKLLRNQVFSALTKWRLTVNAHLLPERTTLIHNKELVKNISAPTHSVAKFSRSQIQRKPNLRAFLAAPKEIQTSSQPKT